jgi:hypothetical protein
MARGGLLLENEDALGEKDKGLWMMFQSVYY